MIPITPKKQGIAIRQAGRLMREKFQRGKKNGMMPAELAGGVIK